MFYRSIEVKPDTVDRIIMAACNLYNWLRETTPGYYIPQQAVDRQYLNTGIVTPGIWREYSSVLQPLTKIRQ